MTGGHLTATLADMAEIVSSNRPRVRAPVVAAAERFTATDDTTKYGWELNSVCERKDERLEDCRPLTLADLEPACRDRPAGDYRVLLFLQILLVVHVQRAGLVNNAESFYKELLDEKEDGTPSQALGNFLRYRQRAQTRSIPSAGDHLYKAVEKRYAYCKVARHSLVGDDPTADNATKYRAITFATQVHEIYAKEDKEDWKQLFDKVAVQMERWRACVAHPGKTTVNNSTVSSATVC